MLPIKHLYFTLIRAIQKEYQKYANDKLRKTPFMQKKVHKRGKNTSKNTHKIL